MIRLKEIRKAAGRTQTDVCNFIGLSQPQYSAWENGRSKIDNISLARLAEYFGVTVDYILGKEQEPASKPAPVRIPVLGSVPAGIPTEAIQDVLDWEEIPAAMCEGGKEYFGLRVSGDSMYPQFLDGDVVIVRKEATCVSGDICVVYVDGYDATLKQVILGPDGSLTLRPKNPEYAPRTYTAQEIRDLPVAICGVVVELRRKV